MFTLRTLHPSTYLPALLAAALCSLALQPPQRPSVAHLWAFQPQPPSLSHAARGVLPTGPGAPRFLSSLTAAKSIFHGNATKNVDT